MIFYFSCTGNTRWAAQNIASALGERLINMADEQQTQQVFEPAEGETVGFCFPVHGWRPPKLVRSFIHRLHLSNAHQNFCWALCTAGDDIGLTMEYLNKDLKSCGLQASSFFSLIMPESYVGLPFMDVDKPEKELAKKETARRMIETFIPLIRDHKEHITMTYKGHWPRINSHLIGEAFVRWIVKDDPFRVTEDCIQCGTCSAVCPVGNIEGGRGQQPVWKHTGACLSCFACYHHCPTRAIRYGKRTETKGQYYMK